MCNDIRAYLIYVYVYNDSHICDLLDSEHVTRLIVNNKKKTGIKLSIIL